MSHRRRLEIRAPCTQRLRAGLISAAPAALNGGGKSHKIKGADGRVKIPTRNTGVWGTHGQNQPKEGPTLTTRGWGTRA